MSNIEPQNIEFRRLREKESIFVKSIKTAKENKKIRRFRVGYSTPNVE